MWLPALVGPFLFGLAVAWFTVVLACPAIQKGTPDQWKPLVTGIFGVITNIAVFGLLKALQTFSPFVTANQLSSEYLFLGFVSCLGGLGMGVIVGFAPAAGLVRSGWSFYRQFTDLYVLLGDRGADLLVISFTSKKNRSLWQRLRDWLRVWRGYQPESPLEIAMRRYPKIPKQQLERELTQSLKTFNDYFKELSQ
jgi:hypothetical protein